MYVIIGANGFLGSYLIKTILEKTNESIIAADKEVEGRLEAERLLWIKCDITCQDELNNLNQRLLSEKENKVIYLAAYHHPDLVEKNPKLAWNINITALSSVLNLLQNVKCFFYPSTDSVYGNSDNQYRFKENDTLNPVNRYGKHKLIAETLVLGYGYNIVRFPFLIGPSLLPFKQHFYDVIVDTLLKNKPFEMFVDSMRSSLDFATVSDLLVRLIETYSDHTPKIVNISGDQDLSKYDVGIQIAKKIGASEELVVPIYTEQMNDIFEVKRAKSTLLDNALLKNTLNISEIKIYI